MSNTKLTAIDTVYQWLGANPGTHTIEAIAEAVDVKRPTLRKALTSLVDADQIRVVTVDGTDCWTADPDDSKEAVDATTQDVDSKADGQLHEAEPATDTDASTADGHASTGAGTDAASPASAEEDNGEAPAVAVEAPQPVVPDMRVMTLSYFLGNAAEPMTVADIATAAGWPHDTVWLVLAAMHQAGAAACDRAFILDPNGQWTAGTTAPTEVNMDTAPSHVTCSLCGNPAPVPGTTTRKRRTNTKTAGGPKRAPGQLKAEVEAWINTWTREHGDAPFTPGQITRAINGNSPGAIRNILTAMTLEGTLTTVPDTPHASWRTTTNTK